MPHILKRRFPRSLGSTLGQKSSGTGPISGLTGRLMCNQPGLRGSWSGLWSGSPIVSLITRDALQRRACLIEIRRRCQSSNILCTIHYPIPAVICVQVPSDLHHHTPIIASTKPGTLSKKSSTQRRVTIVLRSLRGKRPDILIIPNLDPFLS